MNGAAERFAGLAAEREERRPRLDALHARA